MVTADEMDEQPIGGRKQKGAAQHDDTATGAESPQEVGATLGGGDFGDALGAAPLDAESIDPARGYDHNSPTGPGYNRTA